MTSGTDPAVDGGEARWDPAALRAGAGVCVAFAVPLQVIASLLGNDNGFALPLRILALVGFLLGSGVAAWVQQIGFPLAHGLVTAIATFAVVQLAFIAVRAIAGHDLRLGAALLNLTPVVAVGLIGGYLGLALQRGGLHPGTGQGVRR